MLPFLCLTGLISVIGLGSDSIYHIDLRKLQLQVTLMGVDP